ncbi:P-loop containing nucleoside triphosphate hydrolase protein [Aureobasidium pullulans]|uniref:RNA helicase n=1 Tax=Aureobasidium pullulans TaxID=5580 RepID=A0A4S8X2P7_AURPU|nr:P-loop containing nucleoside triphosphate hydrolase protein [Aureobasidium pullulans]THX20934.1 P-loop containing nucleoside triphosphate hydrolase protein [Aureobasidium pullulans]TIA67223.1 P-loop containing nucleoside triphosphate hydrolase protein [Aureobasidium pullulans]
MADGQGLDDIDADFLHVADKFLADIESNYDETTDSFDAMNLKTDLLRGIYAYGFERPSAFQQHAIMPAIKGEYKSQSYARLMLTMSKGKDVVAQARSGSGTTAAVSISVLQKIDLNVKACQVLILAPTRERVHQIQKVIATIGGFTNVECYACIGGTRIENDTKALRDGRWSVVVGTPGRVHDMIHRRALCTDNTKMIVLDEADTILSRGFAEQVHEIFGILCQSTTTQVVLFSATMPQDVLEVITEFMRNPVRITIEKYETCLRGIKHFYVTVESEQEDWKVDSLSDLRKTITNRQAVIFCNTRGKVEWLTDKLTARDFAVSAIHRDMDAPQRDNSMRQFFSGSHVLVATNMLANTIDVQQVPLVINYDLPANLEDYIRRVGHGGSGRLGRKGVAINFVAADELRTMHEIEQFYVTQIEKMPTNAAGSNFSAFYDVAVTNSLLRPLLSVQAPLSCHYLPFD